MKANKIDPGKMTAAEAKKFMQIVLTSTNPTIAKFNQKIMQKILTDRLQKTLMKKAVRKIPFGGLVLILSAETWQEACMEGLEMIPGGISEAN